MNAKIFANFLGTETATSTDGAKTYYRVGILQGMRVKTFSLSAEQYAQIVEKGFATNDPIVADVEIVEGREKTFLKLIDIQSEKK